MCDHTADTDRSNDTAGTPVSMAGDSSSAVELENESDVLF